MMFGILFGAIGAGYIVYGRKQRQGVALLCGVVLCAFPYFFDNAYLIVGIGAVLMAVPFHVRE
ncbi:MAG: amino acid transport protein [candidate division Zixibacteria bacterium]|nr:amino acid transport protein [candidate division Zixibacteria bacterium]MDH3935711.1 amino acid transport protein [candidate division Zixibacteria bacterium]MDH4033831.1 amino acid transport protein [candidate division Zixibacteria bacterium]